MKIAFFGAGLMGSGFVQRLCEQGHEVRVWNRSSDKAKALERFGARAFTHAADAVDGAERLHLSLADDASVDAVLEPLASTLAPTTWVIDHTTTAVTPTAERAARWAARAQPFVHAPVFMAPAHAQSGTGMMLLSGPASAHDTVLPWLQAMTGKVLYLGEDPQRAAAFKLFGNLALIGFSGVLGDLNRLAHGVGVSTAEAFSLFEYLNPGRIVQGTADRIANADVSQPSFEVSMARKDVRLMIEEAERHGLPLHVMPGVAAMFDAAIARGEGALDSAVAARVPGAAP